MDSCLHSSTKNVYDIFKPCSLYVKINPGSNGVILTIGDEGWIATKYFKKVEKIDPELLTATPLDFDPLVCIANMSGPGRWQDLSCRFYVTHEVEVCSA